MLPVRLTDVAQTHLQAAILRQIFVRGGADGASPHTWEGPVELEDICRADCNQRISVGSKPQITARLPLRDTWATAMIAQPQTLSP